MKHNSTNNITRKCNICLTVHHWYK